MRTLARFAALLAVALPVRLAFAADVIPDLAKVRGMESFGGPEPARALLRRNGFVVVPRFYRRIFSPYIHSKLPHYVTADSVHRTFHVIFEEELKKVETAFAGRVGEISEEMAAHFRGRDDGAASLAEAYFAVAARLLGREPDRPALARGVEAELELIAEAAGVAPSPLFGCQIDYTEFKPRGFYTETETLRRYFRAMSWYGLAGFRLMDDRETRAAILIADAFRADEGVRKRWEEIDRVYAHFLGPADDLTPAEYARALVSARVAGVGGTELERFREVARGLRDPRIGAMALSPEEAPRWRDLTKGMRFFGKRYLPDGEIFMGLTHPAVPGRGFPSGLDLMAANGSARAHELLAKSPDAHMPGYAEGSKRAAELIAGLKKGESPSHYIEFLKLVETLAEPPHEKAAAFAHTPAYADKNLVTSLAAWASMRHAWQLEAKNAALAIGVFEYEGIPGYVEPNPDFLAAMRSLVGRTIEIMEPVEGLDMKRFREFADLVEKLSEMVKKELAGERFSKEERALLDEYGETIANLQGHICNCYIDRGCPWAALIADVHTELATEKCLEVGTGGAMPIYVVVEHRGEHHLLVGGVYSYYEFLQPIADRLTDEEWRRMWDGGRMPAMPSWTSSYVAGYDAEALLERVREGEEVDEMLYVAGAAIDEFFWRAVQPGGELVEKLNYHWALEVATRKFGRRMLPLLLELVKNGRLGQKRKGARSTWYENGPAEAAAWLLRSVAEKEDLAELRQLVPEVDDKRACVLLGPLLEVPGAADEELMTAILTESRHLKAGWEALWWLDKNASGDLTAVLMEALEKGDRRKDSGFTRTLVRAASRFASRDMTPLLLSLLGEGDEELRQEAFETICEVWSDENEHRPKASARELARWERGLKAIALEAIGDEELSQYGVVLAGIFRMSEAVPVIVKARAAGKCFLGGAEIEALGKIGTEEAVNLLLKLSHVEHAGARASVVEALGELKTPRAIPRLIVFLNDGERPYNRWQRVCDLAANILASLLPDGPGFDMKAGDRVRTRMLEEWWAYTEDRADGIYAGLPLKDRVERYTSRGDICYDLGEHSGAVEQYVRARRVITEAGEDPDAARLAAELEADIQELSAVALQDFVWRIAVILERLRDNPDFRLNAPDWNFMDERSEFDFARDPLEALSWMDEKLLRCEEHLDAWGNPHRLSGRAPGDWRPFEIYSFGPDGKDDGGAGDDLTSRKPCAAQRAMLLRSEAEEIDLTKAWILYVRGKGESATICKMNLAERKPAILARGQKPVWSHDGGKVLFRSGRDEDDAVYVMDTEGGNVARIALRRGYSLGPLWSLDGSRLAFTDQPLWDEEYLQKEFELGVRKLYVVRADGTEAKQPRRGADGKWRGVKLVSRWGAGSAANEPSTTFAITCSLRERLIVDEEYPPELSESPSLSRSAHVGADGDIYVCADGMRRRVRVTPSGGRDCEPFWLDDTRIIFLSDRNGGQFDLHMMRCDGSGLVRLTRSPESERLWDVFIPRKPLVE